MEYLYHGSIHKLNVGDKLLCHKQYNHNSTDVISVVFATSSLDKAKYFGIVNCLAAKIPGSRRVKGGKRIYMEDIEPNIQPKFYVYSVAPNDFVVDATDEYVCQHDVEIIEVAEFDLVETLDKDGWQIYKTPHTDKKAKAAERIKQMHEFIDSDQVERVNVSELIRK